VKILIVGLGYAGHRFLRSFLSIERENKFKFACVNRHQVNNDMDYYRDVKTALNLFKPEIVVVSVSDGEHAKILQQLAGYRGFIICEKPLLNAGDNINLITQALANTSGFCLDMVERYSDVTDYIEKYVEAHHLHLIRAHFIWGKNRLKDHRSTSGATSEIIHALDLIQLISGEPLHLIINDCIGCHSDFSVSGDNILDSVAITASLGSSIVTGYSSFVNVVRQRTVDFIFSTPDNKLIYAQLMFDTPKWDIDHIKIWEITDSGEFIINEFTTTVPANAPELATIIKLRKLVSEVVCYVESGINPEHPFTDLADSLKLQSLLNVIESKVKFVGSAKYELNDKRDFFIKDEDLENAG